MKFFKQFVVMPTRKLLMLYYIVLKLLSGTNLTLKVDYFDGFVNWSSKADFMINFSRNFLKVALVST